MDKEKYLNIKRPEKKCLLCGKSLVETVKHPSILKEDEETPLRKDFCPECWEKCRDKEYFSYWLTRRIQPDKGKKISKKERNNILLRLFENLYAKEETKDSYVLFFLVHLLMRYKVFSWYGSEKEAGDPEKGIPPKTYLVFENKDTGEKIRIPDREIDAEKTAETKKEIDHYLMENLPEYDEEETIDPS